MITFEIHNIDDKDIGRYRCMASNKFGCDNSVGQLNFESKDMNCAFVDDDEQSVTTNNNNGILMLNHNLFRQSIHLLGQIFQNSSPIVPAIMLGSIILTNYLLLFSINHTDTPILSSQDQHTTVDDCSGSTISDEIDPILKNLQEYIFRCSNNK